MSQNKSGYLDVEGRKVYYEMGGEGHPLVLCHAGFVDSGMWDDQWESFTRQYRVMRYDMGGYGKSDRINAPVSRRDELAQVLGQLNIQQAHLLGCSLGGETALDFTLEHPDMVSALMMVSAVPGGFEMQGEPPAEFPEMFQAMQQGDFERVSELQMRVWIDGMYRQPNEVNPAVRQHAAAMNKIAVENKTFFVAEMEPLNPLNPPAINRLEELRMPVVAIVGGKDHPEIHRAANVMAAEIKGARKVVIENAAHLPNMEQPEEFKRVVLDFLDGIS